MTVVGLAGVERKLSEDADDTNVWMARTEVGRDEAKVEDGTEGLIGLSRDAVLSVDNGIASEGIIVVVGLKLGVL